MRKIRKKIRDEVGRLMYTWSVHTFPNIGTLAIMKEK
jgi:hypothetical protein